MIRIFAVLLLCLLLWQLCNARQSGHDHSVSGPGSSETAVNPTDHGVGGGDTLLIDANRPTADIEEGHHDNETSNVERYPIAGFDWHHVSAPFVVTLWILLACIGKLGMIHNYV